MCLNVEKLVTTVGAPSCSNYRDCPQNSVCLYPESALWNNSTLLLPLRIRTASKATETFITFVGAPVELWEASKVVSLIFLHFVVTVSQYQLRWFVPELFRRIPDMILTLLL